MPVTIGTQLGSYEITALLGKGGMGEVYRARDLKLKREVAIKILPDEFAGDADRLRRFQREAEVLAALNHPNIAAIYDFAKADDTRFLVLELVEGETMADRVARGPISAKDAIHVAIQICEALEAAHERNIIHRDLKPTNIKLTADGKVKVLDFGLAKAMENSPATATLSNSPTMVMGTMSGVILGTPAYMSPEQASGGPADRRSDIWAFGIILYEMLTGKRQFAGKGIPETLAAVIQGEVRMDDVPPHWRPIVERCLTKDPRRRLQAIGEARIALEKGLDVAPARQDTANLRWAIVAGVLAVAVFALGGWIALRPPVQAPASPTRWNVDLGSQAIYGAYSTVAMSPDGHRIVFPVETAGKQMLATRLLSEARYNVLPKTENGRDAFFSPKGDWIAFFADGKLRKTPVQGGAIVELCSAPNGLGGGWGSDGMIVAALNTAGGISQLSENGGTPKDITTVTDDQTHGWPQIVPGSGDIVFTAATSGIVRKRVMIRSARTGVARVLVEDAYFGRVLPTGALVYIQGGVLWGVPFNVERGETHGSPSKLIEDIVTDPFSLSGQFDFSGTGLFVFRSGLPESTEFPVKWLDKTGVTADLVSRSDAYVFPKFSPDGLKILLNGGAGGPAIYEVSSGTLLSRLQSADAAMWMDGKHLIVRKATQSGHRVVVTAEDGTEEQILHEAKLLSLSSVSKDRKWVFYTIESHVWGQQLDLSDPNHPKAATKAQSLVSSPGANEAGATLSPDGHWLAYISSETGNPEVWVRSFPDLGRKVRVSKGGTLSSLVWSKMRNALFFLDPSGYINVAEWSVQSDNFVSETPKRWSPTPIRTLGGAGALDLYPNIERFAIFPPDTTAKESGVRMTFLLNYPELWRR